MGHHLKLTRKKGTGLWKRTPEVLQKYKKPRPRFRGENHPRWTGNNYKRFRKTFCEYCKFIALQPCQLDVDHIDGDKKNNSPENLQTLCANCHRLKSWENDDYKNKK